MTKTQRTLSTNDAMRHMWYCAWSQMRLDRHQFNHHAVDARVWEMMGHDHTWRIAPRERVLACANKALPLMSNERVLACADSAWQLLRYQIRMERPQPLKFRKAKY